MRSKLAISRVLSEFTKRKKIISQINLVQSKGSWQDLTSYMAMIVKNVQHYLKVYSHDLILDISSHFFKTWFSILRYENLYLLKSSLMFIDLGPGNDLLWNISNPQMQILKLYELVPTWDMRWGITSQITSHLSNKRATRLLTFQLFVPPTCPYYELHVY